MYVYVIIYHHDNLNCDIYLAIQSNSFILYIYTLIEVEKLTID